MNKKMKEFSGLVHFDFSHQVVVLSLSVRMCSGGWEGLPPCSLGPHFILAFAWSTTDTHAIPGLYCFPKGTAGLKQSEIPQCPLI